MQSAYIARLNRELQEPTEAESSQRSLQQRFIDWYDALPEISRSRPFAMTELEAALTTQGKYLSPILLKLGWSRARKWSSRGQYHRYWTPPVEAR